MASLGDGLRGPQPPGRCSGERRRGTGRTRRFVPWRRRSAAQPWDGRVRRRAHRPPHHRRGGRAVVRQLPRARREPEARHARMDSARSAHAGAGPGPRCHLEPRGDLVRGLPFDHGTCHAPRFSRASSGLRGQRHLDLVPDRPGVCQPTRGCEGSARDCELGLPARSVALARRSGRRRARSPGGAGADPALPRVERVLRGMPRRAPLRDRRARYRARRALQAAPQRVLRVACLGRTPSPARDDARPPARTAT